MDQQEGSGRTVETTGDNKGNVNKTLLEHAIATLEATQMSVSSNYLKLLPNIVKFPEYTLMINGQQIKFLVDSGATYSVVKTSSLMSVPKLSGRFTHSLAASGVTNKEYFTSPLRCSDSEGYSFKHSFLYSPVCPVDLIGRDLMCKLGLCLISTADGLHVVTVN